MNTKSTSARPSTLRDLQSSSRFSRRMLAGCVLFGASLFNLAGCVGASSDAAEPRQYDSATGELTAAAAAPGAEVKKGTRVDGLSLSQDVSRRAAQYTVATASGKRFKTTVTHRIQRDGADEVISAEDLDTGKSVTWSFGADFATFQSEDGQIATLTGDDDTQTITLHANGATTVLPFAGVVEGSEQEQLLMGLARVTILGNAPFTEDQLDALSATLTAGDDDLGAGSMGWGWFKKAAKATVKGLKTAYCSVAVSTICGIVAEAGVDVVFATAVECPPLAVGAAVVTVAAVGCVVGQVYACH